MMESSVCALVRPWRACELSKLPSKLLWAFALIGKLTIILNINGLLKVLNKIISILQFQAQGNHSIKIVSSITMIIVIIVIQKVPDL